jgi:prepilin-type N-terminal cleavage/methylation domain-containing protein
MTRANGFTLIELLIAMTAGALLLASMSWAVSRLSRDLKQSKLGTSERELLTLSDRLTTLVSTARAGPSDAVELSDRGLSFLAAPPMSLGTIGLVRTELRVTGHAGSEQLELIVRDGQGRPLPQEQSSILLRDQKRVRFDWAGEGRAERRLVALRTIDAQGKAHDLMLPLRIDGDAECQFDVISMGCR